jgi:ElaA protein
MAPQLTWHWSSFNDLAVSQLYQILAARQAVFVVEQKCAFQEADGHDENSWHLAGWVGEDLAAYARVVFPGYRFPEPSIGRVITTLPYRAKGYGKTLMSEAIRRTRENYPGSPIRISAQRYLERFYGSFGFQICSEPYKEDGIPHIDMLLK